ncbi:hypothetical protein RWV98_00820 [Agathobaculum sp. NTUH-O15-33]|uniref:hypothetical protein n=1 Tax=Agathobaculum sp. NTUH-O15-33 TaxID=3079302 RepID=UPI0029587A8D|nr:hypothetical protein [Agathobaculum sp. NTUH-O15-33]WNX84845.1 hypothetical protein RWV98_00820 [Agathobaculum sp. NTUH-O15-33]
MVPPPQKVKQTIPRARCKTKEIPYVILNEVKNLARTRGMNVEAARSREILRRFAPQNDKNLEHSFILQRALQRVKDPLAPQPEFSIEMELCFDRQAVKNSFLTA